MSNLKAIIRIIKQLVYVISPRQKKQSITVFLSMLATSCLELFSVSSIYPLLQIITTPDKAKDKWYAVWIKSFFPNADYTTQIVVFSIIIVLAFLLKNVLAIYFIYLQHKFATDFQCEASTQMLRKYMRRPYEFFINTNSSIILRGVDSDTAQTYQILLAFFQVVGETLTIALIAIFLFAVDVAVSLGALMIAGGCFLFILFLLKGKMKEAGRETREAQANQYKYSIQAINGIKEIAVLDRREIFIKQYEKAAKHRAKTQLIYGVINASPDRIIEGVCISGFIAIVCVRIAICGEAAAFIPVLGSFAMGAFKILPSISKISSRINNMIYYQFGLQNCYDIYREAEKIESEEKMLGIEGATESSEMPEGTLDESQHLRFEELISIDNISWRYRNSKDDVLKNLSLKIHKGESVALVGPSGSGKTTLADVLMGLLKPQSGTILMDGYDIFKIPSTWHKQIGYVPQNVYLIDDTIRANVAFGLPKDLIDDEKVWFALEQAQIKVYVENLPDQLETIVGERGIKFSGGQRQRIALARALYENPEILVLDEATSALDNETEIAVMESIEHLQGQKTFIIIAHRLTTIKNCDKIYRIEGGIARETTYDNLGEK